MQIINLTFQTNSVKNWKCTVSVLDFCVFTSDMTPTDQILGDNIEPIDSSMSLLISFNVVQLVNKTGLQRC